MTLKSTALALVDDSHYGMVEPTLDNFHNCEARVDSGTLENEVYEVEQQEETTHKSSHL